MTINAINLLHFLADELGNEPGRADYNKAAKQCKMTYQGVRYAVGVLERAGYISIEDGKITVLQQKIKVG